MSIQIKLLGSFFLMAILCAIIGGLGIYGINTTNNSLNEVSDLRLPSVRSIGLMMEKLNAIKAEERTLAIPDLSVEQRRDAIDSLRQLGRELDEAVQVYTSLEKTDQELQAWRDVDNSLKQWRQRQAEMLQLFEKVNLDYIGALGRDLNQMFMDHFEWVSALGAAIEHEERFTGQIDPTKCNFGKWLLSFKTNSPELRKALEEIIPSHKELHDVGAEIDGYIAEGDILEASETYTHIIGPILSVIKDEFVEASKIAKAQSDLLNQATEIALGVEHDALLKVDRSLNDLYTLNNQLTDATRQYALSSANRSKIIAITAIAVGVILALGFGFITSQRLAKPLKDAVVMIEELRHGHLDQRLSIRSMDEVGKMAQAMNTFSDNLKEEVIAAMDQLAQGDLTFSISPYDNNDQLRTTLKQVGSDLTDLITQIQQVADQIGNGAMQIAASSQSLSEGATSQAGSLQEITSSMSQMASQTRSNADSATTASDLSKAAHQAANNGMNQMSAMNDAMDEINESGKNIANIIKVIDEIAFQTNLLALNAAVEAARAGQHGKGFAVVAEEVRNLAARSAKAAQETSTLIESSVSKASHGQDVAEKTSEALTEIVNRIEKVTGLVGEIAHASQEQAAGIDQINQGLNQIDRVTQQNTASSEESAAASDELSGQANTLRQLLSRFQINASRAKQMNSKAAPMIGGNKEPDDAMFEL
ncbi:methyl-accepting chemotaxis protein [uncultured Desulfuromonas sp.]|uniref:methyl-accepting chemotaxis protein n=1 Tax=uncultured Desulfuromonas sp. TaxID=181013 RepID=UPI002AAB58B5|nr:methyl-accepting chemotaxis protein [uncultured Desulfuromonas sp.]